MNTLLKYAHVFIILLFPVHIFSQCFSSTGNPIGGATNIGVQKKGMFKAGTFFKQSYSGKYYFGDELYSGNRRTASKAIYNYTGLIAAYGINNRLTLEAEAGYFLNKTKYFAYPIEGSGLSNSILKAKYNIINNNDKRFEFTVGAGAKIPLRQEAQTDPGGNDLHPDVQSSVGAYGTVFQSYLIKEFPFTAWRFFLISQYEYNFPTPEGYYPFKKYNFGNTLTNGLYISKHLHLPPTLEWLSQNWTAILQIRDEWKSSNYIQSLTRASNHKSFSEWRKVKDSGSHVIFLSPQLNYTLKNNINLSLLWDIPLYQNFNGIQLATDYAFLLNLSWDFQI